MFLFAFVHLLIEAFLTCCWLMQHWLNVSFIWGLVVVQSCYREFAKEVCNIDLKLGVYFLLFSRQMSIILYIYTLGDLERH